MPSKEHFLFTLSLMLLLLLGLVIFSLLVGHQGLIWPITNYPKEIVGTIISYRLMRLILAIVAGSSLAISGASLQAIFRNPLADPHLFGISGGAALGACLSIVFIKGSSFLLPNIASIIGGLIAFAIIFSFIKTDGNAIGQSLLIGVLINSLASSLITLLKTMISAQKSQNIIFWLVGHLDIVDPFHFIFIIFSWWAGSLILIKIRAQLEILSFGLEEATLLGINSSLVIKLCIIANCLLIANVVSFSGMIGFVGLVTPHILRLHGWNDLRTLLPLSFLLGAICLVFFDSLSRLSFYFINTEIPVGALCSLFLSPIFFWLLIRTNRAGQTYS